MKKQLIKELTTILAIVFLFGCDNGSAPDRSTPTGSIQLSSTPTSSEPFSESSANGTSMISNNTVDDIALLFTFTGHNQRVLDIAISAHGEYIASSSEDMSIRIWDVGSKQEVHVFRKASVDMSDIDISTTQNLLASGEAIWDLEALQEIHILERGTRYPGSVAFSPDGSKLALGLFDSGLRLWDVTSGQPVYTFPEQEENRTKRMEFSPDGTLLAVGVIDGSVRLWNIENGELVNSLQYRGETDIHDIAFSPDGNYLASGGRVPAVAMWDIARGEVERTFPVRDDVLNVAFSPDGTILAVSGGYEKAILLWDVETGSLLRSLPLSDKSMAIAFSPDGKFLAAGCFDGKINFWGIPTNP